MGMEKEGITPDSLPYTATITTADALVNSVENDNDMPYCFAIYVNEFDTENYQFDFSYSFNKNALPDTNLVAYNELVLAPDITSW
jgi:hypothetical protein